MPVYRLQIYPIIALKKVIPLMIINCLEGKKLPVYGEGLNVRDWIYVEDHIRAIWMVIEKGLIGETYNIGGNNEWKNIDVVKKVCELMADETGREYSDYERLIFHVEDRPGHDLRYALDSSKIMRDLNGWKPRETFISGLGKTIRWYLGNREWINEVKTGSYRKWIEEMYGNMEP
jgi:dTDP-glucose 4,6-dehydratase